MRRVAARIACIALALLAAGCNPSLERQYYHAGIGNTLDWPGLAEATRLQEAYLGYICRQAGLPAVGELSDSSIRCISSFTRPDDWGLFVQTGMNDIDLRCDSYLAWLDQKRRSTEPILRQLADMNAATQAILRTTGIGATPITLVGIAFGLAANTFTNVRSRLLLEVNQSTVQALVLGRRNDYRLNISKVKIDSRPAAIHALRSYLNICTPFTIETDINTTIAVYQQGGRGALDQRPMINAATVAAAPLTAQQTIGRQGRVFTPAPQPFAEIFEETLSESDASIVQRALCVPQNSPNELGNVTTITKTLVSIYKKSGSKPKPPGKISSREREEIVKQPDCRAAKNYYEKITYANTLSSQQRKKSASAEKALIALLNRSPAGGKLDEKLTLASKETRAKIKEVRAALANQLDPLPAEFADHVTRDLDAALANLP
jgi:hypothetical protein